MNVLAKHSHRWMAYRTAKALAGAVLYELQSFDGEDVFVDFNPEVRYVEEFEPFPWVVV